MKTPLKTTLAATLALATPLPGLGQDGPGGPGDAGAAAESAAPEAPEVLMLRLRDGAIHWGSIAEHDPDGFRFQLLAHGGLVDVPWSLLDPLQERELREQFGYVDVSSEELMVEAEELLLHDGHTVQGVILSREGENFVVKVDGNLQMVPKRRVMTVNKGLRLPALDVYGREELYGMFVAESDLTDPEAQLALARRCEQILDFGHAVEHYEACIELDPDGERSEVEYALTRAREKAANQVQVDYLRETDLLRKRGKYDEALARLEAFADTFPASPLMLDVKKKETQVLEARQESVRKLVRKQWLDWLSRLTRDAAPDLDYAGAVSFAEERLSPLIQEKVLEDVQRRISSAIEADDVLAFWAARPKGRFLSISYGLGTWLLGEDRALAGTEGEPDDAEELTGLDAERRELEEKIERFLRSQRAARKARSRAEEADESQTFWDSYSANQRAQWLKAYYIEFSGDLELRDHPYLKSCPSCGGRGVHEVIQIGGGGQGSSGVQLKACPICHGVGSMRRIYYR